MTNYSLTLARNFTVKKITKFQNDITELPCQLFVRLSAKMVSKI